MTISTGEKEKSAGATTIGAQATSRPETAVAANAYSHDPKKLRLRAVNVEKDSFSKYMSKPVTKKISWTQLILAALICGTQIVTMTLVFGRYETWLDSMANVGGGIWSPLITMLAAVLSLWSLKNVKYWKLHLSFATHIINMMACISILLLEFGGNIRSLRNRVGDALYPDKNENRSSYYSYPDHPLSAPMLIAALLLNTFMASGTLVQLLASFVMTLMTGRAICCGQSKVQGKLFELEIAGSETADGMAILRRSGLQNSNVLPPPGNAIQHRIATPAVTTTVAVAPPSYTETVENV